MNPRPIVSKHELVFGRKQGGTLALAFPAGHALTDEGSSYYALKLWSLYSMTYYLVRTRDDEGRYTVFAKKVDGEEGVKFQNPVGTGFIPRDLKTHLEIRFRFPRGRVFMSLFPQR